MNTPRDPKNPDELDRLFSAFFQAQLPAPWPAAPLPFADPPSDQGRFVVEPSEFAVQRSSRAPDQSPTPARASFKHSARARATLAASVALMLGTCWYLSDDIRPGIRSSPTPSRQSVPNLLNDSDAKAPRGGVLDTIDESRAKDDKPGGPKIDMDTIE